MLHQWCILPGPTPGKVIQSTSVKSKVPGDPWLSHWLCRDQGVIPVGFAGAFQPWLCCLSYMHKLDILKLSCSWQHQSPKQLSAACLQSSTSIQPAITAMGGGNSIRPYSQQRPMRMNLSCCLGLIDNGQHKSTNRLLFLVPHERPHGIVRSLENLCMLLPKALKMRASKDTMVLFADGIGGTNCASAQMSWYLGHPNPALLNRQG